MSIESMGAKSTYPLVFVVCPNRGGSAGWASLTASNTADKALLQQRDSEPARGVLARFKVFILRPVQALMRWVGHVLHKPEPSPAPVKRVDEFALPGLQDDQLLTSAAYAELLGRQGGLTRALKSLELVECYGRTSSAEDAWDVLEAKSQGVSARDWAQGSRAAVQIVAQSDEPQQLFLADDLNQFARKACRVIQQRNAQAQTSSPAPTSAQLGQQATWLGPDNNLTRLGNLRQGLLGIRDEQFQRIPAPTPLAAGELLGERFRGFELKAWVEGGHSIDTWFDNASLASRLAVATGLNAWADQATELLFEAEVEKLQFFGRTLQP